MRGYYLWKLTSGREEENAKRLQVCNYTAFIVNHHRQKWIHNNLYKHERNVNFIMWGINNNMIDPADYEHFDFDPIALSVRSEV